MSKVTYGEVKQDAREEWRLDEPENEATHHYAGEVLDKGSESRDKAPCDGEESEVP
jgi:hypothetical protein